MVGKKPSQLLIQRRYPSLTSGDPPFRTSGHVHLGRRIIYTSRSVNNDLMSTRRHSKKATGTIIGFLSELDIDSCNNPAFVATKSSQYARQGESAKLFHIALDERDEDNDTVVVDLEEWELDELCEWIGTKGEGKNEKGQKKQNVDCNTKTEFEKLNNLVQEAAASVNNAVYIGHNNAVAAAIHNNSEDGRASLADAVAAGCRKCKKELVSGEKTSKAHDDNCPRKHIWRSLGKPPGADKVDLSEGPVQQASEGGSPICKEDKSWQCVKCGSTNASSRKRCGKCFGWKAVQEAAASVVADKVDLSEEPVQQASEGGSPICEEDKSWQCVKCGSTNASSRKRCGKCFGWKAVQEAAASVVVDKVDLSEEPVQQASEGGSPICEEDNPWQCIKCGSTNASSRKRCGKCFGWKAGVLFASRVSTDAQGRKKKTDSSKGNPENEGGLNRNNGHTLAKASCPDVFDLPEEPETVQRQAREDSTHSNDNDILICGGNKPWHCVKCGSANTSSRKRCGKCFGWKAGVRGCASRVNTDAQSRKKTESISGNPENEGGLNRNHAHTLAKAPLLSFNDILKSALASYSSKSRKKGSNHPPPLPPPFLSHEENCTLRTALAFVIARARNKGKINNDMQGMTSNSFENAEEKVFAERLGGDALNPNGMSIQNPSPLVGGLLGLPPRDCDNIGQMNLNESNTKVELERELKHVRDVMNLAVSALLPLYKSTLLVKSDDETLNGQKQCAVYDYESAAKLLCGSQFPLTPSDRHLATLDGLCEHIIGRLSSIVNDKALKRKFTNKSSATISQSDNHTESPIKPDGSIPEREDKKDIVRDAVAQLQLDFIIDAFCHSSDRSHQTLQIMASCHVLHRLLLLDGNCSTIGSDCVTMACTMLTDLYHDKSSIGGRNNRGGSNQLRQLDGSRQLTEQDGKGKHQVVHSRWSHLTSSYTTNRQERRKQALHSMSNRFNPNGLLTGVKRSANQSHDESDYHPIQHLHLGDVLAVNLLRLLEGACAIRLHFHRRYLVGQSKIFAAKTATSAAAREVLQEIRSNMDHRMLIPIHVSDAAATYYQEKLNSQERCGSKQIHLLPGAKMMLRIHLFVLIQKLSMYEQG